MTSPLHHSLSIPNIFCTLFHTVYKNASYYVRSDISPPALFNQAKLNLHSPNNMLNKRDGTMNVMNDCSDSVPIIFHVLGCIFWGLFWNQCVIFTAWHLFLTTAWVAASSRHLQSSSHVCELCTWAFSCPWINFQVPNMILSIIELLHKHALCFDCVSGLVSDGFY